MSRVLLQLDDGPCADSVRIVVSLAGAAGKATREDASAMFAEPNAHEWRSLPPFGLLLQDALAEPEEPIREVKG